MSLGVVFLIGLAVWVALACLLGLAVGLSIREADRHEQRWDR